MAFVPEGYFEMGSTYDDPSADDDEKPLHKVYLNAYWIDRTEVTNAMYKNVFRRGFAVLQLTQNIIHTLSTSTILSLE